MMNITYAPEDSRAYSQRLVGKVFKILPVCEQSFETKNAYIESLIREMTGALQTFTNGRDRAQYMAIINTLLYLTRAEYDPDVFRSEVFKCIRWIEEVGDPS